MSRRELLALPPTTDIETGGRAFGIGRSMSYELAKRGKFPVRVLRIGNRYRVPTAEILAVLGIERPDRNGPSAPLGIERPDRNGPSVALGIERPDRNGPSVA